MESATRDRSGSWEDRVYKKKSIMNSESYLCKVRKWNILYRFSNHTSLKKISILSSYYLISLDQIKFIA